MRSRNAPLEPGCRTQPGFFIVKYIVEAYGVQVNRALRWIPASLNPSLLPMPRTQVCRRFAGTLFFKRARFCALDESRMHPFRLCIDVHSAVHEVI